MITIIDVDNTACKNLQAVLSKLGIENQISHNEHKIINSDKLIIPDCIDVLSVNKKIHLRNYCNIIRLFKKPILGINKGMNFMTESLNEQIKGFGFFPLHSKQYEKVRENFDIKLTKMKSSSLLSGIIHNGFLTSELKYFLKPNEFATSSFINEKMEICGTIEYKNYYGVQFNPELSGRNGEILLNNFNCI
jgi:glutamine amidotransferase